MPEGKDDRWRYTPNTTATQGGNNSGMLSSAVSFPCTHQAISVLT